MVYRHENSVNLSAMEVTRYLLLVTCSGSTK